MQARAVADDRAGAAITGINVERIFLLIMAVSAGLAGIAGVMLGSIYSVLASSGFVALIFALVVTVVGGLGSFGGGVIAGLRGRSHTIGHSVLAGVAWVSQSSSRA